MVASFKTVSFLVTFILIIVGFNLTAQADFLSSIETRGMSFISEDYENTKTSSFGFFGATLKSFKSEEDPFKINLTGMYAFGHPVLSYLNVREVYFTYAIDENSKLHIGRKINPWSDVDQKWNLGFFQPQFRWNSLDPETQGLTGFFWDHSGQGWSFTVFGSPVFVPDQGPSFDIKDGRFQGNNPWFQPPPQNILFQNQILPIDYNLEKPETSDVVFQTSYGAQIKIGNKTGAFSNFSALYKPSHQLALAYKGILITNRVQVDVQPKTYYENLISADLGYRESFGMVGVSVIYVRPKEVSFDSNYNSPLIKNNLSWGPRIVLNISETISTEIAGLLTQGGEVTEQGPDAGSVSRSLTTKYLYRNAAEIGLNYRNIFFDKIKIQSQISWLQVENNQMTLVKSKNTVDLKGPWKFKFDFLLIETSDEVTPVSSYRNLDQLWLGASYEF